MGHESTAVYISDLNALWPLGSDGRSTADDHLRTIKATLQTTWPNVAGEVTASDARMNDVFVNAVMRNAANTMSGGSINMNKGIIDNARLQSYDEVFVNKGAVNSGASATLDYSLANNFLMTVSGSVTVTFTNWPSAGTKGTITLEAKQSATGGADFIFPAAVKWSGGIKPPLAQSANTVSSYTFTTHDNGTNIYGYQVGFNQK